MHLLQLEPSLIISLIIGTTSSRKNLGWGISFGLCPAFAAKYHSDTLVIYGRSKPQNRWLFGQGFLQMMLLLFQPTLSNAEHMTSGRELSLNISTISTPQYSLWGQQIYYSAVTSPVYYWHCEPVIVLYHADRFLSSMCSLFLRVFSCIKTYCRVINPYKYCLL